MFKNVRSVLSFGVTFAFVWLAGFGSANATLVHGSIDPAFSASGTLAGLSWTADITFDVGSECLVPNFDAVCTSVSNLDVDGTLTFASQTIPVEFSPPASAPSITLDVNGAGTVIGIGTPPIGPSGFWFFSSPLQGNGFAWVQFNLPAGSVGANGQLFLQQCTNIGPIEEDPVCAANIGNATGSSVFAPVRITQAPEPGSLLLVFGALSAGWFVRRRQQLR